MTKPHAAFVIHPMHPSDLSDPSWSRGRRVHGSPSSTSSSSPSTTTSGHPQEPQGDKRNLIHVLEATPKRPMRGFQHPAETRPPTITDSRGVGPDSWHVQHPVDEGVSPAEGVGQHDYDLAVLSSFRSRSSAGERPRLILFPLLDHLGVVGDQDPVGAAQTGYHVISDLVTQPVGIPTRDAPQPLRPMRRPVPDVIGHLPGALPRHIGQQSPYQGRRRWPAVSGRVNSV